MMKLSLTSGVVMPASPSMSPDVEQTLVALEPPPSLLRH